MKDNNITQWLDWARELQSLGQTGLTFAETDYDRIRYNRLMEIATEILHLQAGTSKEELMKIYIDQTGYATPKIDVRGAIIRDEKILLVQERSDTCWAMPGGWADVGEIPSDMVSREIREESGFEVSVKKVIGVYDANRGGRPLELFHAYKIVFLCEITGGEPRISNETMAVDFFSLDKLPPLSTERTNMRHLEEVFKHFRDNNRQTTFD